MANFSGALKITDLNDFIAPSQDCIVIEGHSGTTVKLIDNSDFGVRFLIQASSVMSTELLNTVLLPIFFHRLEKFRFRRKASLLPIFPQMSL